MKTVSKQLRHAASLIELIVVVGLLAVLFGLLLPAVQRVRQAAVRAGSQNNMRQMALGLHSLSDQYGQMMPVLAEYIRPASFNPQMSDCDYLNGCTPVLQAIVRQVDSSYNYSPGRLKPDYYQYSRRLYQSPADPSYDSPVERVGTTQETLNGVEGPQMDLYGNCSYAVNALACRQPAALSTVFADGTSQTVYMVETFARTNASQLDIGTAGATGPTTVGLPQVGGMTVYDRLRRATFADQRAGDVYPVTTGSPPVSRGTFPPQGVRGPLPPNVTISGGPVTTETIFQTGVPPAEATGRVPYSPYPAGLLAASPMVVCG